MLQKGLAIRICLAIGLVGLLLGTSCTPSGAVTPAVSSATTVSVESTGAVIKIEPSVSSVQVNNTVKVSVKIENITNLTAVETHLSFDTALLEVVELVDGGFVKADFTVQNTFDNTAGTIDYAVAQISRTPVDGSGTLVEIVFRAKANGSSPIRFRGTPATPAGALLSNINGTAIQIALTDGTVNIGK